jgi:predicted AAA+ superfamily ATPase
MAADQRNSLYNRTIDLKSLIRKGNYFLFGPRSTGKSSLIKATLPNALMIDLLDGTIEGIQYLNYQNFLKQLWSNKLDI